MGAINLKSARHIANLSQQELATKLGVSIGTIARWERKETYPDIITALKIASICNINVNEIEW